MPTLFWQCMLVAFLSCIVDIVGSLHIRSLVSNDLLVAVGTVVFINYLQLFAAIWFIDHKQFSKRFALATASAIGAGIGTAIVLCFCS